MSFFLVLETLLNASAVFVDCRLMTLFLILILLLIFYRIFLAYQDLQNSVSQSIL